MQPSVCAQNVVDLRSRGKWLLVTAGVCLLASACSGVSVTSCSLRHHRKEYIRCVGG